jgi:hypothetical protein
MMSSGGAVVESVEEMIGMGVVEVVEPNSQIRAEGLRLRTRTPSRLGGPEQRTSLSIR